MKRPSDPGAWRVAMRAMSLGWELALPIFIGVLLGYALDRRLGTTYVFTLGLMVFGVCAGFYNMLRSTRRVEELHRRDVRERQKAAAEERDADA